MKSAFKTLIAPLLLGMLGTSPAAPTPASDRVSVQAALRALGLSLGLRFTIEQDAGLGHSSGFTARLNPPPPTVKSAEDACEYLRTELPNVEIITSDIDPKLIHLVDGSLQKLSDYPLNQKVTLAFNGTPTALLKKISEDTHDGIVQARGGGGSRPPTDQSTKIAVTAKDCTYREVLSAYYPKETAGTLWIATYTTNTTTQGHEVWITFNRLTSSASTAPSTKNP